MELFALEQFRMVAKLGTMRAAAEKLFLSQPTLSYNLKKLESELGCLLFERSHNRLTLSPYGEIVLKHADAVFNELDAMNEEIEAAKVLESGILHIGSFSDVVSMFFMPSVAADMPEIAFEVTNDYLEGLVQGLMNHTYDLVITSERDRLKPFKWRTLYREQAFLSVPLDSELSDKTSIAITDLVGLKFTIHERMKGYSDWYLSILKAAKVPEENITLVPFKTFLRSKDNLDDCHMVTSFISKYIAANEERVTIPIDDSLAYRRIGFAYLDDCSPNVTIVIKHVLQNALHLLSGNTYNSYYMFPEDGANLVIRSN